MEFFHMNGLWLCGFDGVDGEQAGGLTVGFKERLQKNIKKMGEGAERE